MSSEYEALGMVMDQLQEGQRRAEHRRDNIQDTLGVKAMDFTLFARANRSADTGRNVIFGTLAAAAGGTLAYLNVDKVGKVLYEFMFKKAPEVMPTEIKAAITAGAALVAGAVPVLANIAKHNNVKVMTKKYNEYLDGVAEEGRQAREERQPQEHAGAAQGKSHVAMVEASQSKGNEMDMATRGR